MIVEYYGLIREFCEKHSCDRVQYRDELDGTIKEVNLLELKPNQKRYYMYHKFIWEKYGSLGSNVRHKADDYVQELIAGHFPVETGKRKRGFEATITHE